MSQLIEMKVHLLREKLRETTTRAILANKKLCAIWEELEGLGFEVGYEANLMVALPSAKRAKRSQKRKPKKGGGADDEGGGKGGDKKPPSREPDTTLTESDKRRLWQLGIDAYGKPPKPGLN